LAFEFWQADLIFGHAETMLSAYAPPHELEILANQLQKMGMYSPPPLKKGESLRGVEGDLFKKSPLTPLFQRGGLND
jgi:hypothetical protein